MRGARFKRLRTQLTRADADTHARERERESADAAVLARGLTSRGDIERGAARDDGAEKGARERRRG